MSFFFSKLSLSAVQQLGRRKRPHVEIMFQNGGLNNVDLILKKTNCLLIVNLQYFMSGQG